MKAYESDRQIIESDAALHWKPVPLQERGPASVPDEPWMVKICHLLDQKNTVRYSRWFVYRTQDTVSLFSNYSHFVNIA